MGVISLTVVIISLNTKKSNHYGIYCAMLSCLIMCDLCNPVDCSPGSSARGDCPGKNIGVGCHALLQGSLPNLGIEPRPPTLQVDSLPSEPLGKHSVFT